MKKQAIAKLNQTLLKKTGIDFERYRNQEILDVIGDLILFPKYALRTILWPPLVVALAVAALSIYWILTDQWLLAALFFVTGEFLGLINGLIFGVVVFLRKISDDLGKIVFLSLEQSQAVFRDMRELKSKAADKSLRVPAVSEIVSGVIYIIVLPGVTQVIGRKIPLVGNILSSSINRVFGKLFDLIAGRLDDGETLAQNDSPSGQAPGSMDRFCDRGIQSLEKVKQATGATVIKAVRLATFPFLLVLFFASMVSLGILYLIFHILSS